MKTKELWMCIAAVGLLIVMNNESKKTFYSAVMNFTPFYIIGGIVVLIILWALFKK